MHPEKETPMLRRLKINTAMLICFAFVFRLLTINIGILTSSDGLQKNHSVKNHFTNVLKRRNIPSGGTGNSDTPVVEICEEDADSEDLFKTNPQSLMQVLYFIFDKSVNSGHKIFSKFSKDFSLSHRYLMYQVFRI